MYLYSFHIKFFLYLFFPVLRLGIKRIFTSRKRGNVNVGYIFLHLKFYFVLCWRYTAGAHLYYHRQLHHGWGWDDGNNALKIVLEPKVL